MCLARKKLLSSFKKKLNIKNWLEQKDQEVWNLWERYNKDTIQMKCLWEEKINKRIIVKYNYNTRHVIT